MLTDLQVVNNFYSQQRATAQKAGNDVVRAWRGRDKELPIWDAFYLALPALTDVVTEAQFEATNRSAAYVPLVLGEQGENAEHALRPAGYLTPTAVLDYGLRSAPAAGTQARLSGAPLVAADLLIDAYLKRYVTTMVEDAGREAVGAAVIAEPSVQGFYRKLQTPSCNRCAILVGRIYKKDADFDRHPQCDCTSVPAVERDPHESFDIVEGIRKGSVTGFNKDEIDAIVNNNADINQIVNSKRKGMQKADLYGKTIQITPEGTTRRALAGQRLANKYGTQRTAQSRYRVTNVPRMTTKEIYRQSAGDEVNLIRLLTLHGYIL